ncbi:MAG: hypothetical protein LBI77_00180, partial [Puniceicoccales bacterium]|nr:hypothetical protein [Puniceicoccales bacterium]
IPEEQQKIQNAQNAYANQIFQKWLPFRFERWIENYQESYEENIEKEELKEAMRQYIFKQYKRANDSMRTATKKLSYPEPVLEKIVDIALKFLNKDLPRDEVLFEFQNLAFSNWKKIKNENGEETYDTLNTYKIEGAPDWNLPAKK